MTTFLEAIRKIIASYSFSFRTKALCVAIPGLIIASIVFTYDAVVTENALMKDEIRKRAEVVAHLAARIGELPLLSGSPEIVNNAASSLMGVPEIVFVGFYDREMNLIGKEGSLFPAKRVPDNTIKLSMTEEKDYFDLYAPVFLRKMREDIDIYRETGREATTQELAGWVRIGFTKATMKAAQQTIIIKGLLFALVFTMAIGSLVYVLFTLATRPFTKISKALRDVRKGEFAEISVSSRDEVGMLAAEYNKMVTAVKDRELKLKESNHRIHSLFTRVEHAIFRLDSEGRLIEANKKFEELCGKPLEFNSLFSTYGAGGCLQKASSGELKNAEERLIGIDMAELVVILSLYPEFNEQNDLVGYDGYFMDVTEKKRLEQALIQSQKIESLGMLAGGIAHDFNNILTGILGYASLGKTMTPKADPMHRFFDAIEKSSIRAANLAGQLLAFARKGKYRVELLDLNRIVKEVTDFIKETFDRKINLSIDLAEPLPAVEGDGNQIYQTLMNLCINARDAMPDGGRLFVKTELFSLDSPLSFGSTMLPAGNYVMMSVTDTGIGMTNEICQRIFEPFYTTKGVGKGTGLGLSMVYGIVKNHGGYITVHSELILGTTMRIYLPVAAGTSDEKMVSAEQQSKSWQQGTVLIIDDEEMVRELVRDILSSCGCTVLTAKDGSEGVTVYREHAEKIGLVILDMIMPEKDGRQVFHEIRGISPAAKVILCSGYGQEDNFYELCKAGAVCILQKPFHHNELLDKVMGLLVS